MRRPGGLPAANVPASLPWLLGEAQHVSVAVLDMEVPQTPGLRNRSGRVLREHLHALCSVMAVQVVYVYAMDVGVARYRRLWGHARAGT